MSDGYSVVGDALVVPDGTRLSLAVPFDRIDVWLDMRDDGNWRESHRKIRDEVMPAEASEALRELEARDGLLAYEACRRWVVALNERLGKCLGLLPSGEDSGQQSPPTSGSDTDS